MYFDLLNVLNFINEDKGHVYYQSYGTRGFLDSDGLTLRVELLLLVLIPEKDTLDSYASRYRMQLGFTYKF